jgi:riboflavin biosynthesis pyrimidine reductase
VTTRVEVPVVLGPPGGLQLLFDDDRDVGGLALPAAFAVAYGSDWRLPPAGERPYTNANFVVSRDGRISYAEHGAVGGGAVANDCVSDVWLMGLLRARCDAVMVGDGTVRAEPDHVWTPSYLGGADAEAFEWLRRHEDRAPIATHVFCSLTGEIDRRWAVVARDDIPLVIATTSAARALGERSLGGRPNSEVVSFGDDRVDTNLLSTWLRREREVHSLLCEGGPNLYGSLVTDRAIDEEFVTLSPVLVGSSASDGTRRPSLIEGVGFAPRASPVMKPVSLRRSGDHLMLRSRLF